ncbi:MAG: grasp-with-spasm system SPASM domain peptide maturase [Flavobacterium sp.]
MKKKRFILYSNCIAVKGHNRSTVCDLENNTFYFIPNSLNDILSQFNGCRIGEIKKHFKNEFNQIIDEYFEFLIEKNLIFFNNNINLFPKLNLVWKNSSEITNCIIDVKDVFFDFESVFLQLEKLKCSNIQIRFFKTIDIEVILMLNEFLKNSKSRILSVDFVIPFEEKFKNEVLIEIIRNYPRVHALILYSSPFSKSFDAIYQKMGYLMYSENKILNEKNCGLINTEYFYSNINLFSESQHHNTCLNRKISIDKYGYIRNCPSMPQHFGNIKDTTLEEALEHPDFKKYWNVNKDMIAVCKDCEFRHICTDCRAYTERTHFEGDLDLSKPLKCGYNPYTNEWAEWSTNPLKEKAIEYYGMQDLVKKDV